MRQADLAAPNLHYHPRPFGVAMSVVRSTFVQVAPCTLQRWCACSSGVGDARHIRSCISGTRQVHEGTTHTSSGCPKFVRLPNPWFCSRSRSEANLWTSMLTAAKLAFPLPAPWAQLKLLLRWAKFSRVLCLWDFRFALGPCGQIGKSVRAHRPLSVLSGDTRLGQPSFSWHGWIGSATMLRKMLALACPCFRTIAL